MKKTLLTKTMLLLCALIAGSSSVWATDTTVDFTSLGTQTWSSYSLTSGNVTISTDLGTGAAPTTSNAQYRWKTGNIITISTSTGTLKSIQFKTNSTEAYGPKNLQYGGSAITSSGTSYTWTAPSGISSASFTVTSEARLTEIHVVYTTGGGSSVDAPTFSPAAGAVTAGTTVTLTQDAADAIRYTTDGTDPTKTTGTVYSSPITITTATTIKAIAVKGEEISSVATAVYTINVTAPTFNPESGSYMQGTNFTLTSAGNTIYYTTTTDGTEPSAPTTSSTKYTAPIALPSGTFRIKAIAVDAYGNASSVVTRSYTGIAPTTLPFNWAGGGKDALTALTGVLGNGLPSDYTDNKYSPYFVKLDGTGDYIAIFTNEKPVKVTMGVKMAGGASNSKITVQQSVDGVTFTDVEELTISGSKDDVVNLATTKSFADATRVVKLYFTKGSNVGVGPISIFSDDDIPVTITSAGWASFSNASALDFTGTGVTPHIAKYKDASNVTLSPIAKVPAETGIVVNAAAAGTYAIPVLSDAADATTGNLLKPWLAAGTPTEGTYYTLAAGPKFKRSSGGTLAAGKAYLVLDAGAPELGVDFGETTGVNEVRGQKEEVKGEVYNLAGQRVANPTKGLYIVNGRKVVIK